jgi:hypothetical protein
MLAGFGKPMGGWLSRAPLLSALQACKAFQESERCHVYTTPKTFLELIKLYKSTLARKRKESQEAIDRCGGGAGAWAVWWRVVGYWSGCW